MKKLYRYINVPNWPAISQELLFFCPIDDINKSKASSWIAPIADIQKHCPTLNSFLQRCKVPVAYIKYYAVPPGEVLSPHIDGAVKEAGVQGIPSPKFSLNFPVLNSAGTFTHWYDCDVSNMKPISTITSNKQGLVQEGFVPNATICIDKSKLTEIGKADICQPIIVKTDIMHSASNPTDKLRIIGSVRFNVIMEQANIEEFEDMFDVTNIEIDSQ